MTAPLACPDFRQLYETLLDGGLPMATLSTWQDRHGIAAAEWLAALRQRLDPGRSLSQDESWALYAFSRVNETLLLSFQPDRANWSDWNPGVSLDAYRNFVEMLGLTILPRRADFSAFHHEIVEVEQRDDPAASIQLLQETWPALMLGPLLMSRAGVTVAAGRNHAFKQVAETSTLYWSHRHRNRATRDLSDGWGSNSQWRTSFRCDYVADDRYIFNTEKLNYDPSAAPPNEDELTDDERLELLINRCFITTSKPDSDLWPFDYSASSPISGSAI